MTNDQRSGNMQQHAPLPYVVVLRMRLSDDDPGDRIERKETAYSIYEAVMQAIYNTSGHLGDTNARCSIESVTPDVDRYYEQLVLLRKAEAKSR